MTTLRNSKLFAEKLNAKLDDLEMPADFRERIHILAKMLHISPERARFWLNGYQLPNKNEMDLLEHELGIDTHWLHDQSHQQH